MQPTQPTRLLLADDHRITLDVLRWALRAAPDLRVVGEATDGEAAVRLAAELAVDVAVVDIALPGLDGIEVTRRLRAGGGPAPRVLALSAHGERRLIRGMFRAGATGYVSKAGTLDDLVEAVRAVAGGGTYLKGIAAADLVDELTTGDDEPLTKREWDVLRLIASGRSTKEVARDLNVGVKTAETHRRTILAKLGLGGVADVTRFAVDEGIVPLADGQ